MMAEYEVLRVAAVWAGELLLLFGLLTPLVLSLAALGAVMVLRPWNGSPGRTYAFVYKLPWPLFHALTWLNVLLEQLLGLMQPPPMRLARMASAFVESNVVTTLVALCIPDLLQQHGPQTVEELAAASGCKAPPQWMERFLDTAASLGLVKRWHGRSRRHHKAAAVYAPNALTAALTEHGDCVANVAKMMSALHYEAHGKLAEGLRSGQVPFQLAHNGKTPWDVLKDSDHCAKVFDQSMSEVSHITGNAVVTDYDWGRYEQVVDVGGGVGELTAELLGDHPKLQGVVFDQEQQIERAKEWWETHHPELLPRVSFKAGDFFHPSTLPAPHPTGRTVYMLRNILHDWSDGDAVRILSALRMRVRDWAEDTDAVTLAVVELTSCEKPLPQFVTARRLMDLNMLAMFGDARERDEAAFEKLFAEAGWRLHRMVATRGLMFVIEAVPASMPAGHLAAPAGDHE